MPAMIVCLSLRLSCRTHPRATVQNKKGPLTERPSKSRKTANLFLASPFSQLPAVGALTGLPLWLQLVTKSFTPGTAIMCESLT